MANRFIDVWLSRVANLAALWPLLPAGAVGLVTGYLAEGSEWMAGAGPFGWWSAGLIAFVLTAFAFAAIGHARERFALAKAAREWNIRTDAINPLRRVFEGERILISDLTHPVTRRITNKTFRDCEIFGPANIGFVGKSASMSSLRFSNCEFVAVSGGIPHNVNGFEDCDFNGGRIWNATIFAPQSVINQFREEMPNINIISYEKPND